MCGGPHPGGLRRSGRPGAGWGAHQGMRGRRARAPAEPSRPLGIAPGFWNPVRSSARWEQNANRGSISMGTRTPACFTRLVLSAEWHPLARTAAVQRTLPKPICRLPLLLTECSLRGRDCREFRLCARASLSTDYPPRRKNGELTSATLILQMQRLRPSVNGDFA